MLEFLFIFSLVSSFITFAIPRYLFPLYIWLLLVLYSFYSFPSSYPYRDKSVGESIGEVILSILTVITVIIVVIRLLIIWGVFQNKKNTDFPKLTKSYNRRMSQISLSAYGVLLGYYFYLFITSIFRGFQPASIVYLLVMGLVLFTTSTSIQGLKFTSTNHLKDWWLLGVGTSFACGLLIFASLSYAGIVRGQTYKLLQEYDRQTISYCIQPKISSWLDLTPLTRWNKRSGNRGAGQNHAVLVIQTPGSAELYNWSYKQRRWDHLISGFRPDSLISPSKLRCDLDPKYFEKMSLF